MGAPPRDGESVYYNDVWRTERSLRTLVVRMDGERVEKERLEHTIVVKIVTKMKKLKEKSNFQRSSLSMKGIHFGDHDQLKCLL